MADNRMKDDDLKRDMGNADREGQDFGKQTPGRNPQGGQQGSGQSGQQGGKEPRDLEDDEFGGGSSGQRGGQDRGGQQR